MHSSSFHLSLANGFDLPIFVEGRTPFERRIRTEEDLLQEASSDQIVSMELYFHQFWRPLGHTSLRIGTSLYEFTTTGWKVHNTGADNPRAYLFNNPFFRKQMARFQNHGMKPLSLGITLYLPKKTVDKVQIILENKCAARSFLKKERFNLITQNCNQQIVDIFESCGIPGFETSGFEGFSSVLTFNKLLNRSVLQESPKLGYGRVRVYPLPGYEYDLKDLQSWIYPWVYKENHKCKEALRAIPLYIHTYWLLLKALIRSQFT